MTPVTHQTVKLGLGRHSSPEQGACVMELASMLAGEPFGDHPKAVCPVIGEYLRTLNDGCGSELRDRLYPLAAKVVGSSGSARVSRARRHRCQERLLEVRGTSRSRLERLFARSSRTLSAGTCAAAFLEAGRFDDAVAFVDELLAVAPRDETAAPDAPPAVAPPRPGAGAPRRSTAPR
ncbi:MAG TPA: hypothetical protein VFT50_07130 [Baekduia sp.]|nr:hypothetical protein [Baekduia sp.]